MRARRYEGRQARQISAPLPLSHWLCLRCWIAIDIDGVGTPEERIDNFSGCRPQWAALPDFSQMVGLNFE